MSGFELSSKHNSQIKFLHHIQDTMRDIGLQIYYEITGGQSELSRVIQQIVAVEKDIGQSRDRDHAYEKFIARYKKNVEILESLSPEQQEEIARIGAKSDHLGASARKFASREIVAADHIMNRGKGGTSADKFLYTLKIFLKNNVPAEDVQRYIDDMKVSFSLTGHPTNPTDLLHTRQSIAIENLMDNPNADPADLKQAIKEYFSSPVATHKKTPHEETLEAIAIMDNIYYSEPRVRKSLESALQETGYWKKGVRVKEGIIEPCVWVAGGDGDGNPLNDEKALKDGINTLRSWIKNRYVEDIDLMIRKLGKGRFIEFEKDIGAVKEKLLKNTYKGTQPLVADLNNILEKDYVSEYIEKNILKFCHRVEKTFGLHGAKIDIRHNSESIKKAYLGSNDEDSRKISARLRVAAQYPEMISKLIIAESRSEDDALAAMALLKFSGNQVANKNAKIDIVPLYESVPDMLNAERSILNMLDNKDFARHVNERGYMIVQLAESDTIRTGGIGAGEIIYETNGKLTKLTGKVIEKLKEVLPDEEIKFKQIHVFYGGGADMVRGAKTKPTEFGTMTGYFAAKHGAPTMGRPFFTVQGHQGKMLFSSVKTADYMLEGIMSQNIYAVAGTEKKIPQYNQSQEHAKLQAKAREDAKFYHAKEREYFLEYIKNPSFDKLLRKGPWVSVKLSNLASRPSKRGESEKESGQTVKDIIGKDPKILEQRAITASNFMRMSGIMPLHLLGEKEALEEIIKAQTEKGYAQNNMYDNSKPDRNHLRALAIILHSVNFGKLWMMSGIERPKTGEVKKLAKEFDLDKENSDLVTLCFMEEYAHKTARLLVEVIQGKNPKEFDPEKKKEFNTKDPLRMTWPSLADELEKTYERIEFADCIESHLNNKMNSDLGMVLTEKDKNIIRGFAASTSLRNMPEGMIAVLTAKTIDARSSELFEMQGIKNAKSSYLSKLNGNTPKLPAILEKLADEYGLNAVVPQL